MLAPLLLALAPAPAQDDPLLLSDLGPAWASARDDALEGPLAADADRAIDEGLAWLAWRQRRDGGWDGGPGTTALVTLAFLARDADCEVVDRALSRLAVAIDVSDDPREVARVVLALVEGAGLGREDSRVFASRGLERFGELPDGELSADDYAWRAAATVLAREAGIAGGPSPTAVHTELRRRSRAWTPAEPLRSLGALLVARDLAGYEDDRPTLVRAEPLVESSALPRWPADGGEVDLESWMWGASATASRPGTVRRAYVEAVRRALLAGRRADGSWPASAGSPGGREAATALAVLALDGPRRYRRARRIHSVPLDQGVVTGMAGGADGRRGEPRGPEAHALRAATERALAWLVAAQGADGSWDDGDVGATSLALLALLGDGSTTKEGPRAREVTAAVRWLRGVQDPETGRFGAGDELDRALATAALAETYLLTRAPLLLSNVRRGLADLEALATSDDEFLAAWVATAVASTIQAETLVPAALFVAVEARYAPGADRPEPVAPAILLRALLHRSAPEGDWRSALDALEPSEATEPIELYFATYATFQVGGGVWDQWWTACRPRLLARVGRDGSAGSVRRTALTALTLEVGRRYARVLGER